MVKNYPVLKNIVSILFLLFSFTLFSQTIIKSQSFDSGASGYADNLLYTVSDAAYVNLSSTTSESSPNSLRFSNNNGTNDRDSNVIFDNVDISAYSNVSVTVSFKAINVDKDENLYLDISYNGGSSYTSTKLIDGDNWNENIDWGFPDTDGTTTSNPYTFLVPAVNNQIKIRISASNLDDDDFFYIDNIIIKSDKYCTSYGNNTNFEYINRVQFNTIDKVSGTGTTTIGYSNFTAISTTVTQGSDYEIMITPSTVYDEGYSVWIDYNQDGDFADAEEQVFTQTLTSPAIISGTFKIPATAILGTTRMRVSMKYNDIPTPCESFNYGEVEDYTINITSPTGTYCVSNGNNTNDEYIGRVQLNTFNNPSGPGTTSTGYSDFTSMSTDLIYCALNTITITPTWTASTYSEGYSVWIDYNQDGDFLDFDEQVFTQSKTTTTPVSGTFTIPLSAIPGTTRMRVSMKYYGIPTACESFIYGEVEDYTINIIYPTITWTGAVSTDWNTPGNWSCGGVPTISTDVLIPTTPTGGKYPILSTFIDPSYPEGYAKNIVFESGTTLIIENNALNVAGILTLNGKIDLNNEAQLVQDTGSTFDPASIGTIEIDQQGTSDNFKYNYWGSPVNTTGTAYTIAGVLRDGTDPNAFPLTSITFGAPYAFADVAVTSPIHLSTYWMYKYANLGIGYSGWTPVGKDGNLNAGEGFTMKGSNTNLPEQNYTFVGKPNNGDINLTISANNDYLIGNPYPSALDAKEFIRDNIAAPSGSRTVNIIDGNLYFWDHFGGGNHLLKSYEGGYAIYNLSGSVVAVSNDVLTKNTGATSTSGKVPQRFIPVAQGFFVTAVSGIIGTENIQFKNSQRLYKKESPLVSQFMKTAKTSKAAKETDEDIFPRFHLNYNSPKGYQRQLLVAFIENTTDGVDIGYDAINNETFAEDMSWRTNNINFIIQAVPTLNDERILPLEVKVATAGIIKISLDNAENIPVDTEIFIKDNTTGEMHNISQKPFEIELTAGKYADRFVLTFKTQKLMAEDVKAEVLIPAAAQPIIEGIHVYMNNAISELQIKNNSTEEIVSVALINAVGQTIKTWNSNFNIRTISLPLSTATGVYLVQITTKTGKTVKKISVQ